MVKLNKKTIKTNFIKGTQVVAVIASYGTALVSDRPELTDSNVYWLAGAVVGTYLVIRLIFKK